MTVLRWCDQGELLCARTEGGHRKIPEGALRAFLAGIGIPPPPQLEAERPLHRVVAVVPPDAAARVRAAIVGSAPVEVLHCAYAATLAVVGAPPACLLVHSAVTGVEGCGRFLQALAAVPGLLDRMDVFVVGPVETTVSARWFERFRAAELAVALRVIANRPVVVAR